jgi:hypothetical protein
MVAVLLPIVAGSLAFRVTSKGGKRSHLFAVFALFVLFAPRTPRTPANTANTREHANTSLNTPKTKKSIAG